MLIFVLFRAILESNLLNKHKFSELESDARNVKILPFNYVCNCWLTKFPVQYIHSFSILSDDRSKASSKTIPPPSAI